VLELCRTSWAVRQIAPGGCEWLGDGDGLGDLECDGLGDGLGELDVDGLGEVDVDGLALVLPDGLGLPEPVGVEELVGLCVGVPLSVGLGLLDGLGLEDVCAPSKLADATAADPLPQGVPIGRAGDARTGASAKPDARNDPAATQTSIRPACTILTRTAPLRSSGRREPGRTSDVQYYPQT
jgi:hypothetical protein